MMPKNLRMDEASPHIGEWTVRKADRNAIRKRCNQPYLAQTTWAFKS
jgi:hypothetical protein